jgi:hypothetical protein
MTSETLIYRLICSDHENIIITKKEMEYSPTLAALYENENSLDVDKFYSIKLNADTKSVQRIIDFIRLKISHVEYVQMQLKIVHGMNASTLFDTVHTANYLKITELVHILEEYFKNIIHTNEVDKIRELLSIPLDIDPDEISELNKEHVWD